MSVGFCLEDTDFRILRINETSAVLNGLPVAQHIGQCVADVRPGSQWLRFAPDDALNVANKYDLGGGDALSFRFSGLEHHAVFVVSNPHLRYVTLMTSKTSPET